MDPQIISNITANTISDSKFDIETLIETTLPAPPGNIMRISRLLDDDNVSARKIIEAIGFEPMLVGRILRLANSTIYGLERNVTSIQSAISAIGNTNLREIVMMEMVSSYFGQQIHSSLIARKMWVHSLAVAIVSRELSEMLQMKGTEEAFICGLLHDVGKMIFLSSDFKGFLALQNEVGQETMLDRERCRYDYDHAEIGALIARRWRLQEEVCTSIEYHHNPALAIRASLVTHIVEVADIIANTNTYGLRVEDKERLETSESVRKLNLTKENLEKIWTQAHDKIKTAMYSYI